MVAGLGIIAGKPEISAKQNGERFVEMLDSAPPHAPHN